MICADEPFRGRLLACISLWSPWQVIFLTYLQQLEPPLMDFYEAFSTPEPPQLMAAEVLQHSATLGKLITCGHNIPSVDRSTCDLFLPF